MAPQQQPITAQPTSPSDPNFPTSTFTSIPSPEASTTFTAAVIMQSITNGNLGQGGNSWMNFQLPTLGGGEGEGMGVITASMTMTSSGITSSIINSPSSTSASNDVPIYNTKSIIDPLAIPTSLSPSNPATTNASTYSGAPASNNSDSLTFGLTRPILVILCCVGGFVIIGGMIFTWLSCTDGAGKEGRGPEKKRGRRSTMMNEKRGDHSGSAYGNTDKKPISEKNDTEHVDYFEYLHAEEGDTPPSPTYGKQDLDAIRHGMPTFMSHSGYGGSTMRIGSPPPSLTGEGRNSIWTGPVSVSLASMPSGSHGQPSYNPNQHSRSDSSLGQISVPMPLIQSRNPDKEKKRYTFGLGGIRKSFMFMSIEMGRKGTIGAEEGMRGLSRGDNSGESGASARASIDTFTSGAVGGGGSGRVTSSGGYIGPGGPEYTRQGGSTRNSRQSQQSGMFTSNPSYYQHTLPRPTSTVSSYSQATAHKHATRYGLASEFGQHQQQQHTQQPPPTRMMALTSPVPTISIEMVQSISGKLNEIGMRYQMSDGGVKAGDKDIDPTEPAAKKGLPSKINPDTTQTAEGSNNIDHTEFLGSPPTIVNSKFPKDSGQGAGSPSVRQTRATSMYSHSPSSVYPNDDNDSSRHRNLIASPTSKSLPLRDARGTKVKSILKPSRSSHVDKENVDVMFPMPTSESYKSLWEAALGERKIDVNEAGGERNKQANGTHGKVMKYNEGGNALGKDKSIPVRLELSPETISRNSFMAGYYGEVSQIGGTSGVYAETGNSTTEYLLTNTKAETSTPSAPFKQSATTTTPANTNTKPNTEPMLKFVITGPPFPLANDTTPSAAGTKGKRRSTNVIANAVKGEVDEASKPKERESVGYKRVMSVYAVYAAGSGGESGVATMPR